MRCSTSALVLGDGEALGDLQLEQHRGQARVADGVADGADEALGRLEVPGREVHTDPHRRQPAVEPGGRLAAGFAEHPRVDLDDEARLLGQRHELDRCQQAEGRVLPPHERLDAHDAAGTQVDLRLVADPQLVATHRLVQLALTGQALVGELVHPVGVDLVGAGAVALGPVQRAVGVAQQVTGLDPVVGVEGEAGAGRHEDVLAVELEGTTDGRQQLLGQHARGFGRADAGQQQHERVAREPGRPCRRRG